MQVIRQRSRVIVIPYIGMQTRKLIVGLISPPHMMLRQFIRDQVMQHQDIPETRSPSTEPEIIPPGTNWQQPPQVWQSTGQHHTIRVQVTPLGRVGFAGFLLLMVILGFVGIALLIGAALIGIAAAGVLIAGGIVSSVLRRQFRR